MTHYEYNYDHASSYINAYNFVKIKYFEIKRSLKRYVNKNYQLIGDPNIKFIVKLFKKVSTGYFLDNKRRVFTKIIKKDILPNYNRYFTNKITILSDLFKVVKNKLDIYAGEIAVTKHDLSKFLSKDTIDHVFSFIN